MIRLTLSQLADVVGGDLEHDEDAGATVASVTIDSRTVRPEALFVPLPGARAEGHEFVPDAVARGATGYLWEARQPPCALPGAVVVDDPADALLGLGAWVRDTVDPQVVAVTGSVGKTTTKDFIAAAVGAGRRVMANPGSYNNELGVPLTCCMLDEDSEVLVTEIGARGAGHIARLARLVRPSIAVVTAVSGAHLEMFGDVHGVARAKSELVEALDETGLAVLNVDDPLVVAMAALAPRALTYGTAADADWRAENLELDSQARASFSVRGVRVRLPIPGEHHVGNALAALIVAEALGVGVAEAAEALSHTVVSHWRMELREANGVLVLNDSYNANPTSLDAALRTLARMDVRGRRWAVLGYMAELGPTAAEEHARLGARCAELGLDRLVVVEERAAALHEGAVAAGMTGAVLVSTMDEAIEHLHAHVKPQDAVLVKASRSVGLERIADALTSEPGA